jgi:hypothetical protein
MKPMYLRKFTFNDHSHPGFAFPCDIHGYVRMCDLHPVAQQNLLACLRVEYNVSEAGVRMACVMGQAVAVPR